LDIGVSEEALVKVIEDHGFDSQTAMDFMNRYTTLMNN